MVWRHLYGAHLLRPFIPVPPTLLTGNVRIRIPSNRPDHLMHPLCTYPSSITERYHHHRTRRLVAGGGVTRPSGRAFGHRPRQSCALVMASHRDAFPVSQTILCSDARGTAQLTGFSWFSAAPSCSYLWLRRSARRRDAQNRGERWSKSNTAFSAEKRKSDFRMQLSWSERLISAFFCRET